MSFDSPAQTPVRFDLRSDINGKPGGILAASSAQITSTQGVFYADYPGQVELSASKAYWFSATAFLNPAISAGWNLNVQGAKGLAASAGDPTQTPGVWTVNDNATLGAFQIDVIPTVPTIPEPHSLALGLIG